MIRHGSSHALAYLLGTVAAGLLVKLLERYLPDLYNLLDDLSMTISRKGWLPWFSQDQITILLLAAGLAMIWGMAFKFMHSDER